MIQGVATGVGFLGTGTILKRSDRDEISGLTTAATIWLTAALVSSLLSGTSGCRFLDVSVVPLHGLDRHLELRGDLSCGETLADERENVAFAVREPIERGPFRFGPACGSQRRQDSLGCFLAHVGLARAHSAHRLHELGGWLILCDVAESTALQGSNGKEAFIMRRQDQHARSRMPAYQSGDEIESVVDPEGQVHDGSRRRRGAPDYSVSEPAPRRLSTACR